MNICISLRLEFSFLYTVFARAAAVTKQQYRRKTRYLYSVENIIEHRQRNIEILNILFGFADDEQRSRVQLRLPVRREGKDARADEQRNGAIDLIKKRERYIKLRAWHTHTQPDRLLHTILFKRAKM